MDQIKYDDFAKVEFMVGEIKEAKKIEESDKLIRMVVDFGEEKERVIFSGIAKSYNPEELIGKKTVFVTNVKPRKIMGEESEAMIFAASAEATAAEAAETISILFLDKDLPNGSKVF
ncbi:MAG: methionine--tRNA ligase subunit beta [Candidatus Shapirobacteria bacterium]